MSEVRSTDAPCSCWRGMGTSLCFRVRTPLLGDSSFTQSVMYNTRALWQPSEIPEDDDVGGPEIIIWCCRVSTLRVVNLFKECCWKGSAWLKDIQINWLYFFPLLLLDTSLSDCGNTGQGRPFELLWARPYFCMPHCMNPEQVVSKAHDILKPHPVSRLRGRRFKQFKKGILSKDEGRIIKR